MDLMRLPLGILTGVGFIGAGAIVRKGEMVLGITTAATMWFATVVGLCLGGGQLVLGSTATVIGFLVLWAFRFAEQRLETYQRGALTVVSDGTNVSAQSLSRLLRSEQIHIKSSSVRYEASEHRNRFQFEIRWHREDPAEMPDVIDRLRQLPGVVLCEWSGTGKPMKE
jgi:putative Mg2+ transporter-C (MgtC) family protein